MMYKLQIEKTEILLNPILHYPFISLLQIGVELIVNFLFCFYIIIKIYLMRSAEKFSAIT